jgi:hypothetical protein
MRAAMTQSDFPEFFASLSRAVFRFSAIDFGTCALR